MRAAAVCSGGLLGVTEGCILGIWMEAHVRPETYRHITSHHITSHHSTAQHSTAQQPVHVFESLSQGADHHDRCLEDACRGSLFLQHAAYQRGTNAELLSCSTMLLGASDKGTKSCHQRSCRHAAATHPVAPSGSVSASQAKLTMTPPPPDLLAAVKRLTQVTVVRQSVAACMCSTKQGPQIGQHVHTMPRSLMRHAAKECKCSVYSEVLLQLLR